MAIRVGAHGNSEPEESQLCVLGKTRRSPTLTVDVEPSAARYRRDGPSHGRRVEPLQAIADCVRRSQHDDLCKLPDVVVEDAVGFQVDSCNRERCRQANLELSKRAAANRTAETSDAGLADTGPLRQI